RFSAAHDIRYLSTNNQESSKKRVEIYYGSLTRQIKALKLFSLLTSTGGLLAQPFLYLKAIESGNTGAVLGISACIGFLAVTTPFLIHIITKKYVTHLYYDTEEDKYIANTYSLFAQKKEITFTPEDVVVPDITGMFANCIVKGTPLFLEQGFFYDCNHYIRIMGYDKPIDFKLNTNNNLNQTIAVDSRYKNHMNKK
ncbi:hypothetical protein X777_16400, partial [Ooceraea biroi]